jgi:hypothetical protein
MTFWRTRRCAIIQTIDWLESLPTFVFKLEAISSKQVERFQYYCQFIKKLSIRWRSQQAQDEWNILAEIFFQAEHSTRALCPRLEDITLGPYVTSIRGTYAILQRFVSSSTKAVTLQFTDETISVALFSRYVEIIKQKAVKITLLTIHACPHDHGFFAPALQSVHSANSVESFVKMVTLDTINLDARLLSLELLDTIGDLPLLRVLELRYSLVDELFGDNVQPRRAKFPSLAHLKIKGEIDLLNIYFETYFSFDTVPLSKLDITMDSTPDRVDDLAFLENISGTLKEIDLDMLLLEFPLQFRYLDRLTACTELTSIVVSHCLFISFQGFDAARLGCCQNLTMLDLRKRGGGMLVLEEDLPALDPWGFTSLQPDGADIYFLSILAENLLRLTKLCITIVASPTRVPTPDTVRFQRLEFLIFGPGSFVNHQQPGFDEDEAAGYISDLVLPETVIDLDFIDDYDHPMGIQDGDDDFNLEWKTFTKEHNDFGHRFWRLIIGYVEANM